MGADVYKLGKFTSVDEALTKELIGILPDLRSFEDETQTPCFSPETVLKIEDRKGTKFLLICFRCQKIYVKPMGGNPCWVLLHDKEGDRIKNILKRTSNNLDGD